MARRYSFEDLVSVIKERLSLIDFEQEKYSYEILPKVNLGEEDYWTIIIKYKNIEILQFKYYVSNIINSDGTTTVKGGLFISIHNDSEWYLEESEVVLVTEFLKCSFSNKQHTTISEALDQLLPVSDYNEVKSITSELKAKGFYDFQIKFDTLGKRYIILGNIDKILGLVEEEYENSNLILYKYMSLDTYFSMLMKRTYRMNSIISMNDESEALFLDEELFERYSGDNKTERYKNIVENSHTLISSFTDQHDSGLMWRLYGEHGRGIRLGLRISKEKIKKIHYINQRSEGYQKLKGIVSSLKSKNIKIVFKDADNFKFYMKSDGFGYEDEYRLSYHCDEENLLWTKYGSLISPYYDFSFTNNVCEELGLELSDVMIGAKLPNFDVNYPLLVKLTNKVFKVDIINISKQNKFRE